MPHFYLFLDVDGVLHPVDWKIPGLSDEQEMALSLGDRELQMALRGQVAVPDGLPLVCLPLFEDALRPHLSQVDIVISSSWRRQKAAYRMLLDAMSDDIRARVVGLTPHLGRRGSEIQAWLKQHGKPGGIPVILDDDESEDPSLCNLGVCIKPNSNVGFEMAEAHALRQVLRGYTFVFLDTEFTDLDVTSPELISVGMTPELTAKCFGDSRSEFYGERPKDDWWDLASPWAREHVVPHLQQSHGIEPWYRTSQFVARQARYWLQRRHLTTYLVTNAPEYDFELLKAMLDPWPTNVAPRPIRFDTFCVPGDIRDAVSQAGVNWYRDDGSTVDSLFDEDGKLHGRPLPRGTAPTHHALNDACALRATWERAIQLGWSPDDFYRDVLVCH